MNTSRKVLKNPAVMEKGQRSCCTYSDEASQKCRTLKRSGNPKLNKEFFYEEIIYNTSADLRCKRIR